MSILSRFPLGGSKELKYASGTTTVSSWGGAATVSGLGFRPIAVYVYGSSSTKSMGAAIFNDDGTKLYGHYLYSDIGSFNASATDDGFTVSPNYVNYNGAATVYWYAVGY